MKVDRALEKVNKPSSETPVPPSRKIFIGGIPNQASKEELTRLFQQFGSIEEVSLPLSSVKTENQGYGFISFRDMASTFQIFSQPNKLVLRAKEVGSPARRQVCGRKQERGVRQYRLQVQQRQEC